MKKVYIETLGCQMNKSDSERILGILVSFDYEETKEPKQADLLIINTCNIRQLSADKAYSYLGVWGKWKKDKPHLKLAMCGCVAQQDKKEIFKRAPYVDLVFGTHNIYELPELLKLVEQDERGYSIQDVQYTQREKGFPLKRPKSINAWIPIIDGCNYFCTYCVVPYVRGRQKSRDMQTIIKEAQDAANQGFKEITLLGQTVDSYGNDIEDENITLASLLRELNKIDNILRIRFVTSYPTDITDDLIKAVKELSKVCEYFHIPAQSGSSKILKDMRRRYSRDEYLKLCSKIRAQIPDVTITSDFIAGFPGETDKDFNETLTLIDEAKLDYSNTAAYSPRKRTPAATWKDKYIDDKTKKERLNILNDKIKQASKKSNEIYIGRTLEVLVENSKQDKGKTVLSGRTRNNKIVHFEGDKNLIETLVNVKINDAKIWCLMGEKA